MTMMKDLRQRYCIVGVGNTAYGKTPGLSQVALNVLAIRAALADAGLTTADLDGVLTKAPTSTFPMLWGPRVAEALRVIPKVTGTLDQAGASNIGLIQYAISAIELGQAEVIAISYGDNPRTGTRASRAPVAATAPWLGYSAPRPAMPWWRAGACMNTAPPRNSSPMSP
jgi:acetyl-CoA acetyltransferase